MSLHPLGHTNLVGTLNHFQRVWCGLVLAQHACFGAGRGGAGTWVTEGAPTSAHLWNPLGKRKGEAGVRERLR